MKGTRDRLMKSIDELRRAGKRMSVAAVCERSKVARQTLYKYHKDVIELIRRPRDDERKLRVQTTLALKVNKLDAIVGRQKRTISALTRLCVELKAALDGAERQKKRISSKCERQLRELRRENIDLKKRHAKVVGLQRVK